MTRPRPNLRREWRVCPMCTLDFIATAEGICPRCMSVATEPLTERLYWTIIVTVVTLLVLALTGLWWLVARAWGL